MKRAGSLLWPAMLACALVCATRSVAAQTSSSARLLVLLRNASTLAIVDPGSGKVLGRVPTVKDPHEVTTDGKLAYVCSQIEGMAIIDIAAQKEVRRFNPGSGSASHDVLYANGKVYFTAEGYKAIGRYDPVANTIDWWLGTGQNGTHMLVFSRDMNTLFMPNTGSASVSIVEGIQAGPPKWEVTSVPVPGPGPEGIALSPDGRELWVASRRDGSVSIIDVAGKKVTETLKLGMKDGNRLRITPDGRQVLVLDGGTGTLVVLDAASRKETNRVKLAPGPTGAGGFMISRDGSRAYLGLRDAHLLAVLDMKTLTVTGEFPMGPNSGPGCIAWAE